MVQTKQELKRSYYFFQSQLVKVQQQYLNEMDPHIKAGLDKAIRFYQGKIEGYEDCLPFIWDQIK